ncbi:MAG: PTS sugar transporter subunit IIA [Gammaproteobacteria bacterium]|nr:PTS sugar transporter subunit IIA [Gammaproteobacteria bacterium]
MQMEDILTPGRCLCAIEGHSRKRLFYRISELIADDAPGVDADAVFRALMAREQLGSTGLGHGIAIPHCRVEGCREVLGVLATLREPIDFDAMDGNPVDLLFCLVVPDARDDDHVRTLAAVATLFSDADFCFTLRNTGDADDLYTVTVTHQC